LAWAEQPALLAFRVGLKHLLLLSFKPAYIYESVLGTGQDTESGTVSRCVLEKRMVLVTP
jgi:hypothetical protein